MFGKWTIPGKAAPPAACTSHPHHMSFCRRVSTCMALSLSLTSFVWPWWIHRYLTWANFRAGVATFQRSDTVVFVFVFAIPVCLDPCDPVDCGNSVPPCHSEPVWRNDLVSRMHANQRKPASDMCCHKYVLTVVAIQALKDCIMSHQTKFILFTEMWFSQQDSHYLPFYFHK